MKKIALLTLALALPTLAYADANDIRALSEAKISLVEAIQAAEKSVGGKALDASIEDDAATAQYEVSVTKDGKIFDVFVNGTDGSIISSREDIDD